MRHCHPASRGRARERDRIALIFARHRDRAVAREPVAPFGIAGFQRALDQQAAKARAVDEEVAFDDAAVVERERGDEAILGIEADVGDLPLEARSEEHTSELQSLMRISYAVFCLKKKHSI